MCFTAAISLGLATVAFGTGAFSLKIGLPTRAGLGIMYIGLMELLQFFQHFYVATPEDDYSMCGNETNQFLTMLGYFHISFQPLFVNWIAFSLDRRFSLKFRYQTDMVYKLCFFYAAWHIARYAFTLSGPEDMAPPATKECPNYEHCHEGYDVGTDEATPNLPGKMCTYVPKTATGHIAWVFPLYQPTYFWPHGSVHFFMMFAPTIVTPSLTFLCLICIFTGPVLAAYLTASLNEQPAIWCFISIFQTFVYPIACLLFFPKEQKYEEKIVHVGGIGEETLYYYLDKNKMSMNGVTSDDKHQNGKPKSN